MTAGGVHEGLLVDVQAQPVTHAVAEVLAVAPFRDIVPGRRVGHAAGNARLEGVHAPQVGFQHDVVDLFLLGVGPAQEHGAGHVGVVAPIHAAEIHGDEFALLELALVSHAVRQGTVLSRHHDGLEAGVAAFLVDEGQQLPFQLLFRDAGPDEAAQLGKDPVRGGAGIADQSLFLLVLDVAQAFNKRSAVRGRNVFHRVGEQQIVGVGEGGGLEAQAFHAVFGAALLQHLVNAALALDEGQHLIVGTLSAGLLVVAEIGEQSPVAVLGDEEESVVIGVAAQIADVAFVGDEYGVQLLFPEQGGEAVYAVVGHRSSWRGGPAIVS